MDSFPEAAKDIPISTVDSSSAVLELIYQLKIRDVMNRNLITGKKSDTMRHIKALLRENYITGIPIIDNDQLLGIVSIEDIIIALDTGNIDDTAENRMTRDVIILEEDMPISFAISYLNKYQYSRFPVLNKKKQLVGILTSKDVIQTLLVEMNREVLRLEKMQQKNTNTVGQYSEMEFTIVKGDLSLAGKASTEIKKALKVRNIDPKIIRQVAIASYELEINQVVHSHGGTISCSIQPNKIILVAADTGPGISDVSKVMQEGYSTADEWVRSLGFGAGMGLPNTKRVSDEFSINSEPGKGTTVRSVVFINSSKDT